MTRRRPTIFAAAFVIALSCGKNNDPIPDVPDMGNDNSRNNRDDAGPDNSADEGCDRLEDLGDDPEPLFEREFRATSAIEATTCGADIAGAEVDGAWIGKLRFDRTVNAIIKVDGLPTPDDQLVLPPAPVWEVREAACAATDSVLTCSDERTRSFQFNAGTAYYLVINGRLDSGGAQVQIEVNDLVCEPGFVGCADGELVACNESGTEEVTAGCVGECLDQSVCGADTCADAMPVALEPDAAPISLTGRRSAYSHTWSSEGLEGCNPYEAGPGGPSDGVEFFLQFTGLEAGQTLVLDAEESEGSFGFYMLPQCDPTMCNGAFVFDFSDLNRVEFPVAADGELLVAVEALGQDVDRDFTVRASLRD